MVVGLRRTSGPLFPASPPPLGILGLPLSQFPVQLVVSGNRTPRACSPPPPCRVRATRSRLRQTVCRCPPLPPSLPLGCRAPGHASCMTTMASVSRAESAAPTWSGLRSRLRAHCCMIRLMVVTNSPVPSKCRACSRAFCLTRPNSSRPSCRTRSKGIEGSRGAVGSVGGGGGRRGRSNEGRRAVRRSRPLQGRWTLRQISRVVAKAAAGGWKAVRTLVIAVTIGGPFKGGQTRLRHCHFRKQGDRRGAHANEAMSSPQTRVSAALREVLEGGEVGVSGTQKFAYHQGNNLRAFFWGGLKLGGGEVGTGP